VTNLVWPQSGSLECEANTPVIYGNCAYSTDYREDLRCVDVSNGALKWNKSGFHWDGAVLSAGDQLIILTGGLTPDVVIAQASSDGYQELYRLTNAVPYSGNVHACTVSYPTLCNGKLYVHYPDGTLVCYQVGSSSNVTPPVISISPMSNQVGKIEFSWPSASGALYAVYRTTNLMLGWPAQPLTNNISGNGATMFFSESVGALPKAYYRLKAGN
jgi:outer membrane protein assembly factor BamB